jgi:hypothetical protein
MQRRSGLTLDQLAARTGHPPKLLRHVLREELERRRVRLDGDRYRLVADRFDRETLTALTDLQPGHGQRDGRSPHACCSGCGAGYDVSTPGCEACTQRLRRRNRRELHVAALPA